MAWKLGLNLGLNVEFPITEHIVLSWFIGCIIGAIVGAFICNRIPKKIVLVSIYIKIRKLHSFFIFMRNFFFSNFSALHQY